MVIQKRFGKTILNFVTATNRGKERYWTVSIQSWWNTNFQFRYRRWAFHRGNIALILIVIFSCNYKLYEWFLTHVYSTYFQTIPGLITGLNDMSNAVAEQTKVTGAYGKAFLDCPDCQFWCVMLYNDFSTFRWNKNHDLVC